MSPEISVIIVSYNTREMTLDCLRALYAALEDISAEVFVVDNASRDGSVEAVQQHFPQVITIANPKNAGFGAANNIAIAQARGEYLLLLNSDAFPKAGSIRALRDYLRSHPKAGVVGPRLLNQDGTLQRSCFRFPSPGRAWLENLWISAALPSHPVIGDYRRWPHDTEREVDWVVGACMLVRSEVVKAVGGFDEHFFMYAEESDWQLRIRKAGWRIALTPAAEVVHLGGGSGKNEPARISRHFFDSLDIYERKHHGIHGLVALRLAMATGCFLRSFAWSAIFLAVPRRRKHAGSKFKLNAWLVWRQLTTWRLPKRAL